MFKMTFGSPANRCPDRARKLEMAQRRKQTRRPLEAVLDQQFDYFAPIGEEPEVAVTAKPRPFLWELSL